MSEKLHRARAAASRLRLALDGDPSDLAPVIGALPPERWQGVDPDVARGAALLAGLRPTASAIRDAVAPEVAPSTVARWLDPDAASSTFPWGAWVALRELARSRLNTA